MEIGWIHEVSSRLLPASAVWINCVKRVVTELVQPPCDSNNDQALCLLPISFSLSPEPSPTHYISLFMQSYKKAAGTLVNLILKCTGCPW